MPIETAALVEALFRACPDAVEVTVNGMDTWGVPENEDAMGYEGSGADAVLGQTAIRVTYGIVGDVAGGAPITVDGVPGSIIAAVRVEKGAEYVIAYTDLG